MFWETSENVEQDRGYYAEWGTAEGNIDNLALSVWLLAFSLADEVTRRPPDNDQAKISLNGLSVAFAELYDRYNHRTFIEACGAAAQLGLMLNLDTQTRHWLHKNQSRARDADVKKVLAPEAFERLQQGIIAAWEQRESEPPGVPPATDLSYNGLRRLLRIKMR